MAAFMRLLVKIGLVLGVLGALVAMAYGAGSRYWQERNRAVYRTVKVSRGTIVAVRNSTGTLQPVLSVKIGAFVSGPVVKLCVQFNDEVKKDQLLAEIDPRIYKAAVARDEAAVATRVADVNRLEARLQQAKNDERRALGLQQDNKDFISQAELDQFKFSRLAFEAELALAKASVDQAKASLENSRANLEYTKITSPVDGIVTDRKIDPGQTLASQFQTPELFVVAPGMREEMQIMASVDEADIGAIRRAKDENQPVEFTVDAYPGELFQGKVTQIRFVSTTTQNVVTYPVVISAANPELKLLPGMTADVSFQIEKKESVLKIPNSALRFFPLRTEVRQEDRDLLDGVVRPGQSETSATPSAAQKAEAARKRRHVWIRGGALLRAVPVETGISDYKFTEILSGELKDGQELIVGREADMR